MKIKSLKSQFILSTVFAIVAILQSFLMAYASSGYDGTGTHISLYFLLSKNNTEANHIYFTITPAMGYIIGAFAYIMMHGYYTAGMITLERQFSKLRQPHPA
jgi:hypothetical protein